MYDNVIYFRNFLFNKEVCCTIYDLEFFVISILINYKRNLTIWDKLIKNDMWITITVFNNKIRVNKIKLNNLLFCFKITQDFKCNIKEIQSYNLVY